MFGSFSNYLTALFVKEEDIEMHAEVAVGQQLILDRQREEGLIDSYEYNGMTLEIADAGKELREFKEDNDSLLATVPWWVWLVGLIVALDYFGMLGPLFAFAKRKAAK